MKQETHYLTTQTEGKMDSQKLTATRRLLCSWQEQRYILELKEQQMEYPSKTFQQIRTKVSHTTLTRNNTPHETRLPTQGLETKELRQMNSTQEQL